MERNKGLDLLKAICAFLIICIHSPFPGVMGEVFTPLTRIAVPIFFMISGYYYSHIKEYKKEKKQIVKILKLFFSANILYFIWSLIFTFISGDSISLYIGKVFGLKSIIKFVLFNDSPFGGHLWYLGAILYVLLIVFVVEQKWNRSKLYPLIPVLLLLDLVLGKYSLLLFGKSVSTIFVRNFLCVGLPYFLIGDMLNTRKIKISSNKSLLLSLLFVLTTLLEKFLLVSFDVNAVRDHYISTTLLAVCVFMWAVQFDSRSNKKWYSALCFMGANLSTNIYILHPIIITVMIVIVKYVSGYIYLESVYNYIAPFLILIVAAFASWIYNFALTKTKL